MENNYGKKDNKNKTYDKGELKIYCFNKEYFVIAKSIEEAISLFNEYLQKETDDLYKGNRIKTVELISYYPISKKVTTVNNIINEL